jgi:hypothetical protein
LSQVRRNLESGAVPRRRSLFAAALVTKPLRVSGRSTSAAASYAMQRQ